MSNMTAQEQREIYYDTVKEYYLGMRAALDYNRAAYEAEIKALHDAIERLAKEILPTYDSEFFHKSQEDHDGWDLEGEEAERYEDCQEAFEHAGNHLRQFSSEQAIAKRHQAVRDEITEELRRYAKQAREDALPGFWKGEPWEKDLERWSYDVWGVEAP